MNRSLRQLQNRLNRQAASRNRQLHKKLGAMSAIGNSQQLTEDEAASLSNEVRLSWWRICNGEGTTDEFDNLVYAINATRVRAEALDQELTDMVHEAQLAMLSIRERYVNKGVFGADANALQKIPPALDLHDEFLRNSTPAQLVRAVNSAKQRMERARAMLHESQPPQTTDPAP